MVEERIRVVTALLTVIALSLLFIPDLPREYGTVAVLLSLFGPTAYAHWARRQARRQTETFQTRPVVISTLRHRQRAQDPASHRGSGGGWQPAATGPSLIQILTALTLVVGAAAAFLFLILPFGLMTGGVGFVLAALLIFCCWYLYRGQEKGSWLDRLMHRFQPH